MLDQIKLSIDDFKDELKQWVQQLVQQEIAFIASNPNESRPWEDDASVSTTTTNGASVAAFSLDGVDSEQSETDGITDTGTSADPDEPADSSIETQESDEPVSVMQAMLECVADLQKSVDGIASEQAELHQLYQSRIHGDEVQARVFDRLHDELQGYKQNFLRQETQPLLKDIIYCYDHASRELDAIRKDESRDELIAESLQIQSRMLLDVLSKYDIEPVRGESLQFDRKLQQCVGTIATSDRSLDKTIANRGLTGFTGGERILRREQVTVYKLSS